MNLYSTYRGKRVFITGHTGFKGSWLALWLQQLGAEVCGYALPPASEPNHFSLCKTSYASIIGDIRDADVLTQTMRDFQPEIVFHLAAQPLVRYSYHHPIETYQTNVLGTLNVLEACREIKSVKTIVCITTDKVYENHESNTGYVESDRLGGYDPYSASKACAELLVSSHVQSYFNPATYGKEHEVLVATARGGNVVGGGDWSEDRLIPDIVRAAVSKSTLEIRNPQSVRPWQHVLDCLSGYLLLGAHLIEGNKEFLGAWNFGPIDQEPIPVEKIVSISNHFFPQLQVALGTAELHETGMLQLNCQKAVDQLHWKPLFSTDELFVNTFAWYHSYVTENKVITFDQITAYTSAFNQSIAQRHAT